MIAVGSEYCSPFDGNIEIVAVEQVEDLGTKLQPPGTLFKYRKLLGHREIPIVESRTQQQIPARRAQESSRLDREGAGIKVEVWPALQ